MENITDNYKEHEFHQSYHSDCSTCYSENRMLKSWEAVNRQKVRAQLRHDDILKRHPALAKLDWHFKSLNPLG